MKRHAFGYLQTWLGAEKRQPLIIRGARQVGKTWIIRELARTLGRYLIELNFEAKPELAVIFSSNSPKDIVLRLGAALGQEIQPGRSILFLDEVQEKPELLAKLRWFAEEMPELPCIATGSLLEFALTTHNFSMPVGRVTFLHLEPMTFEEFLLARGKASLLDYLTQYTLTAPFAPELHQQLLALLKEYTVVGGMPAAVAAWCKEQALTNVSRIHHDLWATFRTDFSKYRQRIPLARLDEAVAAVPRLLGQKFIYSEVNSEVPSAQVKDAIGLLNQARICYRVSSTAGDGLPLAAQTKAKFFKEILLDVGLACSALNLSLHQFSNVSELTLVNSGGIAEQIVGQLLRSSEPFFVEPVLYYWHRDERGSQAELDYLIAHNARVLPIEVKAGATGTLKSLHLFMKAKKLPLAVRLYSGLPAQSEHGYQLISLPLYLSGQLHRILSIVR